MEGMPVTAIQCFLAVPSVVLIFMLIRLPAVMLACMTHEAGHVAMARLGGDDTAKRHGYTTINPIKFIDPLGLVLLLFCGFGWSKQAPVNVRRLSHRRVTDVFVTLSGPIGNLFGALLATFAAALLLAFTCDRQALSTIGLQSLMAVNTPMRDAAFQAEYVQNAIMLCRTLGVTDTAAHANESLALWARLGVSAPVLYARLFLLQCAYVNIGMALFNLLPIPPLDMFHLLNDNLARGKIRMNKQGFLVCVLLIMVVFIGLEKLNWIIVDPITAVANLFTRAAEGVCGVLIGL